MATGLNSSVSVSASREERERRRDGGAEELLWVFVAGF